MENFSERTELSQQLAQTPQDFEISSEELDRFLEEAA
jgi:hypothetical protein